MHLKFTNDQNTEKTSGLVESLKKPVPGSLLLLFLLICVGIGLQMSGNHFDWSGYLMMSFFYGIMFYVALKAGESVKEDSHISELILAGRSLPIGIALFSMAATWVGGGFINGTAESVASYGLAWTQAPWGYALSLVIGGLFFAGKMRRHRFTTLLDPIEDRFGAKLSALFYLPALMGEVFWTGAILTALGTTSGALLGLDFNVSIILSALITIAYTALGGMKAVAKTDVLQLGILLLGLWFTIPFVLPEGMGLSELYQAYRDKMGALGDPFPPLTGWEHPDWGSSWFQWWDYCLLLIFGGIPWHVYFQRVLSSQSAKVAKWLSIGAGCFCLMAAFPALIIGMTGAVTDWAASGLPAPTESSVILPWVLKYKTPFYVATIGLGALAAAVMSSADSSVLSASSLGAWNVYRPFFLKGKPSHKVSLMVKKLIWIIGISAMLIALKVKSVYALWFLCSDFVYCILFPQLVLSLYDPKANRIGSFCGFLVAITLRFGGGEPVLGIPTFIQYPLMNADGVIHFPFRTFAMISSLLAIVIISRLTQSISPSTPLKIRSENHES